MFVFYLCPCRVSFKHIYIVIVTMGHVCMASLNAACMQAPPMHAGSSHACRLLPCMQAPPMHAGSSHACRLLPCMQAPPMHAGSSHACRLLPCMQAPPMHAGSSHACRLLATSPYSLYMEKKVMPGTHWDNNNYNKSWHVMHGLYELMT